MRKSTLLATIIALTFSTPLFAHDLSHHKGKPIEGTVSAPSEKGFTLKTKGEEIPVRYGAATHFEANNAEASNAAVVDGVEAHVIGTRLASGELVAKEVLITNEKSAQQQ